MFKIITDSASNLTEDLVNEYDIDMISYTCTIDDEEYICYQPGCNDEAEGKKFYDLIRNGAEAKTSLISPGTFIQKFESYLESGLDVLFICMSAELTGTYQSAIIAANDMEDDFPDRKCIVVDSMSASLGEGFLVLEASKMRAEGCSIEEVVSWIENNRLKMRHIFTVDNLKYLRKGGRISSAKALVGTVLNLKPILRADENGRIELYETVRGRKKALDNLVKDYLNHVIEPLKQVIGIAHCDCLPDAKYIADCIMSKMPAKNIIIRYYDRCSGAHVGPGAICLFFMGGNRYGKKNTDNGTWDGNS